MSTKVELQQIKRALAGRPKGPGRRLSPEVRELIAQYALRRSGEGASRLAVRKEVGICDQTLVRVLSEAQEMELLPVRVSSDTSGLATVRGPGGLVIEGLDLESLAALIRALS